MPEDIVLSVAYRKRVRYKRWRSIAGQPEIADLRSVFGFVLLEVLIARQILG